MGYFVALGAAILFVIAITIGALMPTEQTKVFTVNEPVVEETVTEDEVCE